MSEKINRFLAERRPETPCLVVDLDVISDSYKKLTKLLPLAQVFYAVKANPAPEIVAMLKKLGSSFDTASRGEIDLVLEHGAKAEKISFGSVRSTADGASRSWRRAPFHSASSAWSFEGRSKATTAE